ncbi:hypothetical protein XO10_04590 [Marinitoga sp. 1135]|uniref:Uncharacterized protein n=1 Tax=Marinitoga piezophila (strain DSM 14283 / JCM 11233 / KA3) TaxID=443254 RepID=H2J7T3_MARPK|nr:MULTISPECIES: hypothetical protein [Marinitoga]AEX85424.1 hypothetical protein Marpi_1012 [Marinitoga piezophila KA3]APT75898.1 hypothetical protein LN42_05535 [Marinitoga sp. 1137]NUU95563.1 hypothetical protein [Marinitoga sp. 1135]
MKKVLLFIFALSILFSGCIFNKEEVSLKPVAETLAPLREYISTAETIIGLAQGKKEDVIPEKTVNIEHIPDLIGKTPEQVYIEYGGTGSNTVRVPNTGYFDNFYGKDSHIRAAFYMTPTTLTDESTGYILEVYMDPYLDLSVKYDYEKYKVAFNSWEFKLKNLLEYKTVLSDGSVVNRNIIEQKEDWDSTVGYAMFEAPDILQNLNEYLYPDNIPQPATTTGIDWYSHTISEIDSFWNRITAEEFYTESSTEINGEDIFMNSGITYIKTEKDFLWDTDTKTVVRFKTVGKDQTTKSFTATGNIGVIWYSASDDVTIDATGSENNLTHYKKVFMEWWDSPENISENNFSYKEIIELEETGENTAEYEGTIKKFWNGNDTGNGYYVSLKKDSNDNYVFSIGWQWFEATDKSITKGDASSEDSNIESFQIVDNELVIKLKNGGTFKGHFANGAFVGTYEYNGETYNNVIISSIGIALNDQKFKFNKDGNLIE